MSTFHGLEMAKRALFTQQLALHTTGHNIANANTKGYSRQRVNFQTTTPYPSPGLNRPQIPGQIGTGVEAGTVERIRTAYLDAQYRSENSKSGYWRTMSESMTRMEELMNEPSKNGLSHTMNQFWDSLQILASNPENSGARSVVAQRGQAVAGTFNYLSESLTSIRSDLENQIKVTVDDTNSLLDRIHNINEQLQQIEPHGYLANDLYDERDRLIDKLSEIVTIETSYQKSADSSLDVADGLVTIELLDDNGQKLGVTLVDGTPGQNAVRKFQFDDSVSPAKVTINDDVGDIVNFPISDANGSLNALIHAYGYEENGVLKGTYPNMLVELDKMAKVFAEQFNDIHQDGYDLNGNSGVEFFKPKTGTVINAETISVNPDILSKPELIAAATERIENPTEEGLVGDGRNAQELADILYKPLQNTDLGANTSIDSFYQSLIGKMGVQAQQAKSMVANTEITRSQVENQRLSVSAVSLDEEIANMVKFQHAYNAAARSMTAIDEILDKIINGMGIVGR